MIIRHILLFSLLAITATFGSDKSDTDNRLRIKDLSTSSREFGAAPFNGCPTDQTASGLEEPSAVTIGITTGEKYCAVTTGSGATLLKALNGCTADYSSLKASFSIRKNENMVPVSSMVLATYELSTGEVTSAVETGRNQLYPNKTGSTDLSLRHSFIIPREL